MKVTSDRGACDHVARPARGDSDLVAARGLARVERLVGALHEREPGVGIRGVSRGADRDGHAYRNCSSENSISA